MTYTIDRIEESIAVLEDEHETCTSVPVTLLPDGAREGDVLTWIEPGIWAVDAAATAARRARIRALESSLRAPD